MANKKPIVQEGGQFGVIQSGDAISVEAGGTGLTSFTSGNFLYASNANTLAQMTPAQVLSAIGALPTSSYTASDILSKLLTVDGAGSGLDADLLDGQHGSYYFQTTITGNAGTATTLQTPRTINGVSFNGSANITITAASAFSLTAGNGLSGTAYNGSAAQTFTLGTPTAVTLASTNSVAATSHTHAFTPGGTTAQYIRGDGTLTTFPSIPNGTVTSITAGSGMTFTTITGTGPVTMGTPGTLSGSTANAVQTNSHTHALSTNLKAWDGVTVASKADISGAAFTGVISSSARIYAGYDSGTANSISCSGWFRASGATGLFCADYGGGIYMTDTTYVRTFGSKQMAAADFVMSSDISLKYQVADFKYNGRLRPVSYRWRDTGKLDDGFIANEIEHQYPTMVSRGDDNDTLKLSYPKLTIVLSAQLNNLEDEVQLLKARISELEQRI